MQHIICAFALMLAVSSSLSFAGEKPDHFPALESPDIATALCHMRAYNQKLTAITNKDSISAEDMVKIHELTYTLENALERLKITLDDMAFALEEVHLASERLDAKVINESSKIYLDGTSELLSVDPCI